MSSAISSTSGSAAYNGYQADPSKDQFKQDMQSLQAALQSGDLSGAQDAFTKIQDMQQQRANKGEGQNTQAGANGSNPMKKDMDALQSALQSGNVQDAQSAFAQLQTDMKAKGGHHGHHHHQSSSDSQTSTDTSASNSTATATVYA